MIPESDSLRDYLLELREVDYSHPIITAKAMELFNNKQSEIEKIQIAFEFVRDHISHSWDIQSQKVTCNASEVLEHGSGICYAKSNLLAALLRSQNIPVGFCYQRLMLFDTPEKGYCIHALNAVYIQSIKKWIRLDARGNKPGIDAQFSIEREQLAFQVNKEQGEVDYPTIFPRPNEKTIKTLREHKDAMEMYVHNLPETL
ncbi:transglutaminase-like domain-containing protein [Bacillus sp. B1-b2]|uniref:transglutaminase-like domain-containing protein n=1 Tax=Bacillus sp. B1-b2 TaxID=2653201 RepID=UPI0012614FAB|nr:transglutaminase family protein [Bacillus sp. B1-b2]KAB7671262.1 transglutaminase family protein [Bacillus sp. B1-b2]